MTDKTQKDPRGSTDVDSFVGTKLRQRRLVLGMSQTALGDKLGVTFQQVQKYERGQNRLGASRLFNCSQILGVKPAYFFDGLDPASTGAPEYSDPARTLSLSVPGAKLMRQLSHFTKPQLESVLNVTTAIEAATARA